MWLHVILLKWTLHHSLLLAELRVPTSKESSTPMWPLPLCAGRQRIPWLCSGVSGSWMSSSLPARPGWLWCSTYYLVSYFKVFVFAFNFTKTGWPVLWILRTSRDSSRNLTFRKKPNLSGRKFGNCHLSLLVAKVIPEGFYPCRYHRNKNFLTWRLLKSNCTDVCVTNLEIFQSWIKL